MTWKEKIARWLARREAYKQAVRWLSKSIGRPLTRKEKAMLQKLVLTIFGSSWQTTVLGWAATAVGITSTVGWFTPDGKPNYGVIVLALLAAVFSRQVKDASVTGGTRPPIIP
jgi:uncharacterized membrane protein YbaN (DUF454 family)